mmetsp:Transcript_18565/g.42999  ORF Transcript_18565/g.42999 Transcript_18565/m.42999 type:complete len:305 (-) Transcript_18565:1480-2394(-)
MACKTKALETHSLLVIYLHSPLHRNAKTFLTNTLLSEAVMSQLEQQSFVCLGVSIHSAQGAQLAQMLSAASYPLLCILQPPASSLNRSSSSSSSSTTSLQLFLRVEGHVLVEMSPTTLAHHLSTVLQRHQVYLAEQEARRLQLQQEVQLRQEQDAEYQAALLADQERQRQLQQERDRIQQAEREALEAQQAELRAKQDRLEQAKRLLGLGEPTSGDITRIRFVLSSGRKLERKFLNTDTIQVLRAFLTVHFHESQKNGGGEMINIGLSTSFPKRTYNDDEQANLTLQDAGLSPQAVLMVQDLDA